MIRRYLKGNLVADPGLERTIKSYLVVSYSFRRRIIINLQWWQKAFRLDKTREIREAQKYSLRQV